MIDKLYNLIATFMIEGFLAFLLAFMMTVGLLALIGAIAEKTVYNQAVNNPPTVKDTSGLYI